MGILHAHESKDELFLLKLRMKIKHMEIIERHAVTVSTEHEETVAEHHSCMPISSLRSFS